MDVILTKLSELRNLWETIGYDHKMSKSLVSDTSSERIQDGVTALEWQSQKLSKVIDNLKVLIVEEEAVKLNLQRSIKMKKTEILSICDDLQEQYERSSLIENLDLTSLLARLEKDLEVYTKKHELLIKSICKLYEEIDNFRSLIQHDFIWPGNNEEATKKLLENRLDVRFNIKLRNQLSSIRDFLAMEYKNQESGLVELGLQLVHYWESLYGPVDRHFSKSSEEFALKQYLVKHQEAISNDLALPHRPSEWTYIRLKTSVANLHSAYEERGLESSKLVTFVKESYLELEKTAIPENIANLLTISVLNISQLEKLKEIKSNLLEKRRLVYAAEIERYRTLLLQAWQQLRIPESQHISFLAGLQDLSLQRISETCQAELDKMATRKELVEKLLVTLDARTALIQEMTEFETKASDPKRLFAPSFRLLYEEKFRKNAYPNLLQLEKKIYGALENYHDSFGEHFIDPSSKTGEYLKDALDRSTRERYVNETVFEFPAGGVLSKRTSKDPILPSATLQNNKENKSISTIKKIHRK